MVTQVWMASPDVKVNQDPKETPVTLACLEPPANQDHRENLVMMVHQD